MALQDYNKSATLLLSGTNFNGSATINNFTDNLADDFNNQEINQPPDIGTGMLIWAIINGVLLVVILGGNILTIVAVRTCRNLRSVISNLFISSLAISDFMVGVALPYHLAFYLGSDLGKLRGYCLLRFFLFICACCVSILTLISIAVDRYIAVMYALHYRRFMTRRVAYVIIISNWCVGAIFATIPIFWNKWSEAQECELNEVLPPWYVAGLLTPGFIVIWICMLMVYYRIMREASKQAQRLRQSVVVDTHASVRLHSDWKSVQIVVFIMGCFTICWLPYICVAVAQLFNICRSNSMIYKVAFSLAVTNSALNPIIYSWKNSNFRKAYARTLCCRSPSCCCYCGNGELEHLQPERQCPKQALEGITLTPLALIANSACVNVKERETNYAAPVCLQLQVKSTHCNEATQ